MFCWQCSDGVWSLAKFQRAYCSLESPPTRTHAPPTPTTHESSTQSTESGYDVSLCRLQSELLTHRVAFPAAPW